LSGTITPHQLELIRGGWEHIEFLEKSLTSLDAKIDEHLQSYRKEYELLQTIPGVSKVTAAALIAEIGVDMEQFPSSEHLSSWAGVALGNHESAGKKKYSKRQRQLSCQSSLMRSGLGHRSLPKHRVIRKVLENCFSSRQEKSVYRYSKKSAGHWLPHAQEQATLHRRGFQVIHFCKLT
jgi:hypothetical protein